MANPDTSAPPEALLNAWNVYGEYDQNANRLQARFRRMQFAILLLGVLTVLFVAMQKQLEIAALKSRPATAQAAGEARPKGLSWMATTAGGMHWLVLTAPLVLSALMAAAHTFRPGDKWVILRGAAESVKEQIFRFRTGTGEYAGAAGTPAPQRVLCDRLDAIEERVIESEVKKIALEPPAEDARMTRRRNANGEEIAIDDGVTPLTSERYLELRVDDQIDFYARRTLRFDREITRLTIYILILGIAGAFFGAVGWELWIPLATVSAAAFMTYLRYTQSEETLGTYNRAKCGLKRIRRWWNCLPSAERPGHFDKLVDTAEQVLQEEVKGWSQRMADALGELNKKPETNKKPATPAGPG